MKQTYKDKIKELRSGAQETQAAIKIRDKLTELRSKNVLISSYRWIWELIQNAKDCPNQSGKIDIEVNFDSTRRIVEFRHNGKLFSTKNIVYLIEQVSTKERTRNSESTGKFGTGFLTTNLLSPIVKISGLLHDDDDTDIAHFEVTLDRSGYTIDELKKAIKSSCDQLESNTATIHHSITGNEMNTAFSYRLDDNGMQAAKNGLDNFLITAPYVFAFVSELNKITINNNGAISVYTRTQEGSTRSDKVFVSRICKNNDNSPINILTIRNNALMLAVEIKQLIDGNHIVAYNESLPKLFCDFPLLGTHDFSFPVVINCKQFDPNEPRNGKILYDKESEQNKSILQDACALYTTLIEYFIQYDYKDIHNAVRLPPIEKKDWIDRDWYEENIILLLKTAISNFQIFTMEDGTRKTLFDNQGVQQVFLSSNTTKETRKAVWNLSSQLNPDRNVRFEDIDNWYNSLWDECRNLDIAQLISATEEIGSLTRLSAKVSDAVGWLTQLYILLSNSYISNAESAMFSHRIVPNQNGVFCCINQLKADGGIDEAYKDASKLISIDFRSELLDRRFISKNMAVLSFNEAANQMINSAQEHKDKDPGEFYKYVIGICSVRPEKQMRFIDLYNSLFPNSPIITISASNISDRLLNCALEYWCRRICSDISRCSNLSTFSSDYDFDSVEASEMWLTEFVSFLRAIDHIEFLDRYSIIPNQNGNYKMKSYLYYDVDSIPEFAKDVCFIAGVDFRDEVASTKIDVSYIVPRKKGYKDVSEVITKYMREHMNNINVSSPEREAFNNTYRWLREHKDDNAIKQHFKELLNHLYWFYNDDEISESISKANEFDNLLSKFGIADVKQLEIILTQKNSVPASPIFLTKELLCQYGISSKEELQRLINGKVLDDNFLHFIDSSFDKFQFAQRIIQRALTNIQAYLRSLQDYDLSEAVSLHKTIFLAKKDGREIYIIARPSDYNEVILYYDAEFDTLDYTKDFELWVEDGKSAPQKLTFGRILKLTGVNRIPLRRLG